MPQNLTDKKSILEAIAEAWNRNGLNYAVSHGLESYPASVGRDLDIIVEEKYHKQVLEVAVEQLDFAGYTVTIVPHPWSRNATWLFGICDEILLQIDVLTAMYWNSVLLVSKPNSTVQIGPFAVDPWASFAKRVLMRILHGCEAKEPWIMEQEEPIVRDPCNRLFGKHMTGTLLDVLEKHDQRGLEELTPRLRRLAILRSTFFRPLEAMGLIAPWVSRIVRPRLGGITPVIALVGPDGVGKSATIQHLPQAIPRVFLGTRVRYWRPGILPRLGAIVGKAPAITHSDDGLIYPRREPGRFHWLRLAYYWLDFVVGHFVRDRYDSSALRIVCYDRCALDMVVDPARYGLSPARGIRLLWRVIPKPDLVVLLYDDPERIHARKPELPIEEIERQLKEWLRLAEEGEVDAIIRVDAPPEEMARRIAELITEVFIEKNGRAIPGASGQLQWLNSVLEKGPHQ